jgi:hypothetical protein
MRPSRHPSPLPPDPITQADSFGPPDPITQAGAFGPPDPITQAGSFGPPDPITHAGSFGPPDPIAAASYSPLPPGPANAPGPREHPGRRVPATARRRLTHWHAAEPARRLPPATHRQGAHQAHQAHQPAAPDSRQPADGQPPTAPGASR